MMRVAFQGIPGSFSSMAARALFGDRITFIGTTKFRQIFELVTNGSAEVGVVPVENALAGSVHEVLDLLYDYDLTVTDEYYCPVRLSLLAYPSNVEEDKEGRLRRVTTVLSHPKALEQCSKMFQDYPWMSPVIHSDTAGAAKEVADRKDPSIAALASEEAGALFELTVLDRNVQNHEKNTTRFFALSKNRSASTGNKISLALTIPHEPGSLCRLLQTFEKRGVNLTKIESRPILGRPYEYLFYMDATGESSMLQELSTKLPSLTSTCRIFGRYEAKGWES